jgi:aspartate aminotransferase
LHALAKVMARHENLYIISDEIYEYINYTGRHESIAQFDFIKERVIVINGVSKGYAMTGWRIGYMAANIEIAKACDKLQGQTTSGPSSISQQACVTAINTVDCVSTEVSEMVAAFRERRELVMEKLNRMPGVKPNSAAGAFYVFPNISYYFGKSNGSYTINNDSDFCLYMLDKAHVAIVPGEAFGNANCVRLSYATSKEKLMEAMERMESALAELK